MRRPIRCRAAIIVAGACLTVVPFVGAASAVSAVECTTRVVRSTTFVVNAPMSTAILSGCTPLSATGGWGVSVTNIATHMSKTTWAGHRGTTIERVSAHAVTGPNHCREGANPFVITGRITGGSGAAMEALKVGWVVRVRVCVRANAPATLEPGSLYRFNAGTGGEVTTTTAGAAPTTTTSRPAPTTTTTMPPSGDAPPPAVALPSGLAACPANSGTAMITLVNRDRHVTGGLPALTENANLDWAARTHSVKMASTSNMTHDGWDTEIHDSHYVVGAPGWTGQNIAWMTGGFAPDTIESGFFNELPPDDGHRLNILSTNFHHIGIGCIINGKTHAYWWSQDFGS